MENLTYTETRKQQFPVAPPPLKPRKQKALKDCYSSFIDQIQGGDYGGAILVRIEPRTHRDTYFKFRPRKAKPTEMRSYRRNYSHRNVALYRTKAGGPTRENIAYLTCSFLELDGSTNGTIKSRRDVEALIRENGLPEQSYVIPTSKGHYHIIWTYDNPLPWTTKGESFWLSQQKLYIELFQKAGFNVDKAASMNPCQFLRNPSQLQPYNFKRRCKVHIYKSYRKTSLRRLYRALNKTNIPNPKRVQASVRLRRDWRENKTFITTHKAYAKKHGVSERTSKREIQRAIQNGDLRIVARIGNNAGQVRTTKYESLIFIERFPEVPHSISTSNALPETNLLKDFQAHGAENGRRNKTLFALGLHLKAQLGKRASIGAIRAELAQGARACHVREKEFERTLRNIMKPEYTHPLSRAKMREWNLIEEPKHRRKSFLH